MESCHSHAIERFLEADSVSPDADARTAIK